MVGWRLNVLAIVLSGFRRTHTITLPGGTPCSSSATWIELLSSRGPCIQLKRLISAWLVLLKEIISSSQVGYY